MIAIREKEFTDRVHSSLFWRTLGWWLTHTQGIFGIGRKSNFSFRLINLLIKESLKRGVIPLDTRVFRASVSLLFHHQSGSMSLALCLTLTVAWLLCSVWNGRHLSGIPLQLRRLGQKPKHVHGFISFSLWVSHFCPPKVAVLWDAAAYINHQRWRLCFPKAKQGLSEQLNCS